MSSKFYFLLFFLFILFSIDFRYTFRSLNKIFFITFMNYGFFLSSGPVQIRKTFLSHITHKLISYESEEITRTIKLYMNYYFVFKVSSNKNVNKPSFKNLATKHPLFVRNPRLSNTKNRILSVWILYSSLCFANG